MNIFNEKMIRKLTGTIVFERGEKIYLNGGVRDILVERGNNSGIGEIKAVVSEEIESANNKDVYILLNYNRENIEEFSCNCYDFMSQRKDRACKHIVAAYLRYIKGIVRLEETAGLKNEALKLKDSGQISFNLDYVQKIPDTIKEALTKKVTEPERVLLNLDFTVSFYIDKDKREAAIELMIGENRLYKVMDAREFLNSVKNKNYAASCEGGFAFIPKKHYFNDRDMTLLRILTSVPYIKCSIGMDNSEKLIIDDETLNFVFQLLYGRSLSMRINNREYKKVKLLNEDLPLRFRIIRLGEYDWRLKQLDELPVDLTGKGKHYFYNGNIYIPTIQQIKSYTTYYTNLSLSQAGEIAIKQSNRKVKNELIPLLKSISRDVEVIDSSIDARDSIKEIVLGLNFKTHICLDKTLSGISLALSFLYEDIEIDLFSESKYENAAKVKNRQVNKERIIIQEIRNMDFETSRRSFVIEDEDKILDFLVEGINKLKKLGEVAYSEAFKNIRVYDSSDYKVKTGIREDGLLEFSFSIQGISNAEFAKVLDALKAGEKYYQLIDGGYISLDDKDLRSIMNLVEYLDAEGSIENGGTLVASKYNALYVEQYFKDNEILYIEKNRKYKELVDNISTLQEIDFTLPEHIDRVMRPYQKIGYKWLKTLASYGFGGILADEMGLGKTLQAIAFIASEAIKHENPVLVVVPTSIVYNWEQEIKKFAPELKTLILYGKKQERISLLEDIKNYDIVITSYAVVRNDISYFEHIEFSYCFLDEAQQIKNTYTANARSVKQIKAKQYFAITGTPMENSLLELWSVFDFIMPGYLLSKSRFNKVYADPIVIDRDKNAMEALKKHITPFMLRRLKTEVMQELPPKIEQRLVVEMTDEQKVVYMGYVYNARKEISREFNDRGSLKNKINVLSALTRLRQICCDPSVVLKDYEGESGKMLALDEVLDEAVNANHRVLVFSQFTSVLQKIALMLRQKDIDYYYLDGSTKSEDRLQMSIEFNEGSRDVFLVSLKAGGFGLNLTGADIVVHFDPWWNPAVEEQATDRAHRIGQTKTVEVIKLVARGTVEEKVFKLQEKKRKMIEDVVMSSNADDLIVSSLTKDDFEELFSYEV